MPPGFQLLVFAHAAASGLPDLASTPLHNVQVADPTGMLLSHAQGLRPNHSSGAAADDPLLFRHRFQHHNAATDSLLYYQYEAKRHPNVVVLTDMVESCEASDGEGGDDVTDIKVATSVPMNMTNGTIIVGDVNCTFREADGTSSPWRSTLRERVLSSSIAASAADSQLVNLRTVHAALNEIFQHAQLELFQGRPHAFDAARDKRLASLANNGGYDDKYGFASADAVIADAKKDALARRRLADAARPQKQKKSSPQNTSSANRRELYHTSCNRLLLQDGVQDDFTLVLQGTDCNDGDRPGPGMEDRTCFWKTGDKISLKAGNEYTLRWKSNTNERVEIFVQESDGGWGSTHCADLSPRYWITNRRYTSGDMRDSPNVFTFTMPDAASPSSF
ncbi:hypothetical protein EMIHUDRAFT_432837, partial [Emiliania huxleyi CCMP1516]|uniref:Uncharacterized protein n=2 Tax=Emiliania huxleyi TaxID=2903 RepID=A0A0D3IDT8_EMIH1